MRLLQRICPHWFGWSYNTMRRRRWCRVCATQERLLTETVMVSTALLGSFPIVTQRFVEADPDWDLASVYDDLP